MTTKKQPPAKRAPEEPAGRPENPFISTEFFSRMRDYTERDAAFSKEIKAIGDRGAGKLSTDARTAPSLAPLRGVIKKGLPLNDMFARIVQGVESGLWEPWLTAFGFELRGVNYAAWRRKRPRCLPTPAFPTGAASWRKIAPRSRSKSRPKRRRPRPTRFSGWTAQSKRLRACDMTGRTAAMSATALPLPLTSS
jgi:hypothetical protein